MIKLVIVLYLAKSVSAAFDYRENPPAALFPIQQAAADGSLPDSISNPAYLPRIRYPYLTCSGSMPYSLSDIYSSTLRAGYGARGFGVQVAWNRFGFEEYMEHIVEANFACMPVRYVSIGMGIRYYNIAMKTVEASLSGNLVDGMASIMIAPFEWIEIAFLQDNLGSLFIRKRRDLLFPGWSAGAALKPFRGFSLMYNITGTPAGYVNSVSASANILKYFSLKAGYALESTTGSAAVSILYKYVSVSYGLKYHPQLGITHTVGVTLSTSEMSIDSLSYGSIFSMFEETENVEKTDINSCSLDRLRRVPGLDAVFAERIMKYRQTMGPLTRAGLLQVGMTEGQIDALLLHATGLVSDKPLARPDYGARDRFEKAQKELFRKLIGLGLPAASALECAELALRGERKALIERLRTLPGMDGQKTKKVLELCAIPQ